MLLVTVVDKVIFLHPVISPPLDMIILSQPVKLPLVMLKVEQSDTVVVEMLLHPVIDLLSPVIAIVLQSSTAAVEMLSQFLMVLLVKVKLDIK